ncbi:MAG: hypothetical protein H0V70_21545 [Ktedonobacteraceae bacterium]|nr:hypothetical protein [Ktedonobacteraceae bacterium]
MSLTEYGIMVSGITPRLQSIPWSEARLFAIANPSNFKYFKDRQPMILEVASEHNLVRWIWLRSKSFRSGFAVPVLPPEEYEQQWNQMTEFIKSIEIAPWRRCRNSFILLISSLFSKSTC